MSLSRKGCTSGNDNSVSEQEREGKEKLTGLHQCRVSDSIPVLQHLRPRLLSRSAVLNLAEEVQAGFHALNVGRKGGNGVLQGSSGVLQGD